MMKTISIILTMMLTIISSSAFGQKSQEPEALSGAWIGKLEVLHDSGNYEALKKNTYTYLFQICSGEIEVRYSKDGKMYFKMSGPFEMKSTKDSILVYTQNTKKRWVQANVWSIIKLSDDRAYFHLLRTVSNFGLKVDHKKRYFALMGKGNLKKISNECNVIKKKP